MDLAFTPQELAFRDEVRTWLDEHRPREPRPHDRKGIREFDTAWQRQQYEGGWAGISWPQEYGGRGLPLIQALIWFEEYGRLGLPGIDACFVGLSHAGPTLIERATDEQKEKHLRQILRGEVVWCQGFSEPEAGSDLAGLQTRAVIDGDQLVVTGQKIWTSYADVADWQELLVRTDPSAPKHKGITWVICDMSSPGIDIRPIRTMDGEEEFCEVFYDEVRIPLSNVVGQLNEGWGVAMSTLSFERGTAFTVNQVRLAKVVEDLIELAKVRPGPAGTAWIQDDEMSRLLATARAEVAAMRAMTYAGISRSARHGSPGPEGSIIKLYYSDLAQRIYRLAFDLIGDDDGIEFMSRWDPGGWSGGYLFSHAASIGGGTSEIQRNIIGDRVLGLPR